MRIEGIETVKEQHTPVFAHCEGIILSVQKWQEMAVPRLKEWKCGHEHGEALASLIVASRKSLEGVYHLCEQKLAGEAIPLIRRLFEACVNAAYIRLDPSTRAPLFNLNPRISQIVRCQCLWELRGSIESEVHYDPSGSDDYTASVTEVIKQVGQLLDIDSPTFSILKTLAKRWAKKDLSIRAREVETEFPKAGLGRPLLKTAYDIEFGLYSEFTHGTGSSVMPYVKRTETGVTFDSTRSDRYVADAMIIAAHWYLWLLHEAAQSIDGTFGHFLYENVVDPHRGVNDSLAKQYKITMELT